MTLCGWIGGKEVDVYKKLLVLHGCTIWKGGMGTGRMAAWHMHTQEPLLDARMYQFLL